MRYFALILLVVFIGCSSKKDTSEPITASDTTVAVVDDSSMFAGVIRKFEENDELYTELFFKKGYEQELYDFLAKSSDSLVYQGDEIKRSALPNPVAAEYFDLRGLEHVDVFDVSNQLIGTAKLERVEFLEQVIQAGFVGVFKLERPSKGEPAYCLSEQARENIIKNFSYNSQKTETLNKEVTSQLSMSATDNIKIIEVELRPDNETLWMVSDDTTAFIYQKKNKILLYKSERMETIDGAIPLPIAINGKPLLLINFSMPETDVFWDGLMKFNGKQYELCPRNRFKP
jgi:hypothetical protein